MKPLEDMTTLPACAIVAMGVSGCGKSTLMTHLAATLDCPGFEGDDFHDPANVAKMRAGRPLDDADRWPWLDRLGRAIGAGVADKSIAVAACSALKRAYRERLAATAGVPLLFVLLDGKRDEIAAHIAGRNPHYMPPSLLDSQFDALERPGPCERALVLECYQPVAVLEREVLAWAHLPDTVTAR